MFWSLTKVETHQWPHLYLYSAPRHSDTPIPRYNNNTLKWHPDTCHPNTWYLDHNDTRRNYGRHHCDNNKSLWENQAEPPTPFTGKWNEFVLFMQDIYIYLKVNQHLYDNDNKKISFISLEGMLLSGSSNLFRQRKKNMNETKLKNWTGELTKVL
jgi:hypothetical protein